MPDLGDSRRGTWIVNLTKHLLQFSSTSPALVLLDRVTYAGKCGCLLMKLTADQPDQMTRERISHHARLVGISPYELDAYLTTLEVQGCLSADQKRSVFEVLTYSTSRVLQTTGKLFREAMPTPFETALLELLEHCLLRPRLEGEVKQFLKAHLSDEDVDRVLDIVEAFQILGAVPGTGSPSERLYFNAHQFADKAREIGPVLKSLSHNELRDIDALVQMVEARPGLSLEDLAIPPRLHRLATHLGLVEVSRVMSPGGEARFLTLPRLAPPSVGRQVSGLEHDVFHHGKLLLSSVRFGETRSDPARGQIQAPAVLVGALLDRERIGPCTAIGQDYLLLESEGVIRTIPSERKPGQFYMQLRRREPAELVLDLLEAGSSDPICLCQPKRKPPCSSKMGPGHAWS